jgi:hypothetical protein
MAFTAEELSNINNSALEHFIRKGRVELQNIENKPMLKAFDASAKTFPGGKEYVSVGVASGQGGGSLAGYTGDDQVPYYNPVGNKRARYPWREHHIGMVVTHTELKNDGIDVVEDGSDQDTREMSGREEHVLAGILESKMQMLGEDYSSSMDTLIHGDGSADAKALAGIRAFILESPSVGTTGGLGRTTNSWWRNRAATAANAAAGGQGPITSAAANGGALIEFLEKEWLQLARRVQGSPNWKIFAGSDFIAAYQREIRSNGSYSMTGFQSGVDGGMGAPTFKGKPLVYDPTLDNLGLSKRAYIIDMSPTGIQLYYMQGNRMKKHNPARPYDRYVMYNGITTTAVMVASRLNTSAVYDIA